MLKIFWDTMVYTHRAKVLFAMIAVIRSSRKDIKVKQKNAVVARLKITK